VRIDLIGYARNQTAYENAGSMMNFVKSAFEDADGFYMVEIGEQELKDEAF
jgi:GTP-binding protein Era